MDDAQVNDGASRKTSDRVVNRYNITKRKSSVYSNHLTCHVH